MNKKQCRATVVLVMLPIILITVGILIFRQKNPIIKGLSVGNGIITYNNLEATAYDFYTDFGEMKYLGRTEDKDFEVYVEKGDASPQLFTFVGSDNTYCYKANNYQIPSEGTVTKVFIDPKVRGANREVLSNIEDIIIAQKIVNYTGDVTNYKVPNVYTDGSELYFAFNDCPVSCYETLAGYIAYVSNQWVFVNSEVYKKAHIDTTSNEVLLTGVKITDLEIIKWLKQNLIGM